MANPLQGDLWYSVLALATSDPAGGTLNLPLGFLAWLYEVLVERSYLEPGARARP